MCPNNPIGTIDLYLVSHHGTDPSGSPLLVHALQPRVAVMQNGTRKGAALQAMTTMRSSPGLEDIWQLHWSYGAGIEQNSAGVFIANVEDAATTAAALTAPPRGGGGGRGGGAPGGGAPAWRRRASARGQSASGRRTAAGWTAGGSRAAVRTSADRRPCRRRTGWRTRNAASSAHARVLDQDHGAAGRLVHGVEQPQQLQQDLRGASTRPVGSSSAPERGEMHAISRVRCSTRRVDGVYPATRRTTGT